jgi:hypothetical protein
MKKLLIIQADTNDADYVYNIQYISDEEIKIIQKLVELIKTAPKDRYGFCHNWANSEYSSDPGPKEMYKLSDDEYYVYDDYIPNGEHGIHTIKSIRILDVENDIDLLKEG